MPLNATQQQSAQIIYNNAISAGLTPSQALQLIGASYSESGLNPTSVNGSSGAAGLFQLLSKGYVDTATRLGGVFNPSANTQAILPSYVSFFQSNPNAVPGQAASTVEASGEPASWYAGGLNQFLNLARDTPGFLQSLGTGSTQAADNVQAQASWSAGHAAQSSFSGAVTAATDILKGATALQQPAQVGTGIFGNNPLSGITGVAQGVGTFVQFVTDPSNWLRIMEIAAGFALVGGGLFLLAKQVGLSQAASAVKQVVPNQVTSGAAEANTAAYSEGFRAGESYSGGDLSTPRRRSERRSRTLAGDATPAPRAQSYDPELAEVPF
jgi:hypothetical protein